MGDRLPNSDSGAGRRGLLEWAPPVICDRLRDAYERRLGPGGAAPTLARLHERVWRALIAGDEPNFEILRSELAAAIEGVGLGSECLENADAQTMSELLDIVLKRFQRSEREAKGYHLALIELAERLVASRRTA